MSEELVMDKEVLKEQLAERFQVALDAVLAAVEAAPDGRWIEASEWVVRESFQKLMRDCYQDVLQARMQSTPQATGAAFSPSRPTRRDLAEQGGTRAAGTDRRR
jgi:hypothetical protein